MRDRLIQIGELVTGKDFEPSSWMGMESLETVKALSTGAELIPMPETIVKKGKPVRPLMMQFLQPKEKNAEPKEKKKKKQPEDNPEDSDYRYSTDEASEAFK